ncbi:MAG TPA: hypothetical protein VK747_03865 [Blastocatellia bacterium]|nr:hypothetical protein [Blastocatellia bacterium]
MPRINLMVIGVCVCVAGVAFIGIGPRVGIANPEPLTTLLLGVGFALMGLHGIVTGKTTEGYGTLQVSHYGAAAKVRGAAFGLLGILISAGSLFEMVKPGSLRSFLDKPAGRGVLFISLAAFGLLASGLFFFSKPELSRYKPLNSIAALLARLIGVLIVIGSLALMAIGALLIIAPEALTSVSR